MAQETSSEFQRALLKAQQMAPTNAAADAIARLLKTQVGAADIAVIAQPDHSSAPEAPTEQEGSGNG